MACNEIGFIHEIDGVDWLSAETKMRYGHGSGLAGVVREIALGIIRGVFPDNLDRVFVCSDRSISSQTVEEAAGSTVTHRKSRIVIDGVIRDVVLNPDAEVVLRITLLHFLIYTADHGGGEFL